MRRKKAIKRGRRVPILVPILAACGLGYLVSGSYVPALRSTELSAAETVALRFPETWNDASAAAAEPADAAPATTDATTTASATTAPIAMPASAPAATDNAQLALLSPEPMMPPATPQQALPVSPQPAVQTASAETAASVPGPAARPRPAPVAVPALAQPASESRAAIAVHRRAPDRPGYVLNDAQIASIKTRLQLTPDQERMWPAVEAALRNIAYTRMQEARARNAAATQVSAVDPNAVQGLKSAAVPLIMSFNSEQKEEVRNLAHIMGLDQLAAQF
jgi:hypothetical protein